MWQRQRRKRVEVVDQGILGSTTDHRHEMQGSTRLPHSTKMKIRNNRITCCSNKRHYALFHCSKINLTGIMLSFALLVIFVFPSLSKMNDGRQNLVPIPQEKRESLLLNVDNESAESLNMEVLPILNEVLISNRFQHEIPLQENHRRLRISEWNAERGLDWDILPSFYSNSDIIILNEMDWGMARSGNKDTAQQMSESLEMNYAYGVEFLELTNGNEKEINATIDQKNHIGYHGNAILSKWKILQSKIVRLHPLYELLYEEKASGQAKGERRLGGRMALFASIETDVGVILVISMHAHSGSKRNLLRSDAVLVCDEISKWNITNVIIGGDIASPIPKWLVSGCGFWALDKTNSQKKNGGGLMPSWKVGEFCIAL